MITLKNIKTLSGDVTDHTIESSASQLIEGHGHLLMLPALIDTDALKTVSFQNDGAEAWLAKARTYLSAGITTLFDARAQPASNLLEHLNQAQSALRKEKLGLHYYCYCDGNEPALYDMIGKIKQKCVGIKISLDLSDKPIAAPHLSAIDRIFQIAAQENLIVIVALIQGEGDVAQQRKTASQSVEKVISFAQKYSAELCLQHVRTAEELTLAKQAKDSGILVYTETAYIHLFVSDKEFTHRDKKKDKTYFLPTKRDQDALWKGINDGTIDMVGSAGLLAPPQIFLTMMLQEYLKGNLQLSRLIEVTRSNAESIFRLPHNEDAVLVDLVEEVAVPANLINEEHPQYLWQNKQFKGWVKYTIAGDTVHSYT